jgi:DNA-binding LacI/PurR family transcriptional regulator
MVHSLTEVAEKVGISEATVSRVLNGGPGVSAATRTAVLTALDVLGYERPVATAERLLLEPELVVRGSTAPPAARATFAASTWSSGRDHFEQHDIIRRYIA